MNLNKNGVKIVKVEREKSLKNKLERKKELSSESKIMKKGAIRKQRKWGNKKILRSIGVQRN